MAKPGKRNLRKAIEDCGGVISDVAESFGVTRQTVYNWLDHYKMRANVQAARQELKMVARDNIYGALMGGDVDVSKWVLMNMGDDGEMRLSAEALRALALLGLNLDDAVRQFEMLVQAEAAKVTDGAEDD